MLINLLNSRSCHENISHLTTVSACLLSSHFLLVLYIYSMQSLCLPIGLYSGIPMKDGVEKDGKGGEGREDVRWVSSDSQWSVNCVRDEDQETKTNSPRVVGTLYSILAIDSFPESTLQLPSKNDTKKSSGNLRGRYSIPSRHQRRSIRQDTRPRNAIVSTRADSQTEWTIVWLFITSNTRRRVSTHSVPSDINLNPISSLKQEWET